MAKSEVRIDKWIWAMRIFKTRTIATEACKKGRVTVGDAETGVVAKPSRMIKVGDVINVRKPPVTYSFKVKELTENRLGAKLVPEYMDNITPQSQYDLLEIVKISGFIDRKKGLGRPTKREGRELARFTQESMDYGWDFDF
ncbi:MAG: RNA-binding S4 domain-containing protein, partial [Muribaculaceae bacterium]|nr:RNA-binding S4 domain-containing protein [Muribaculaceae bacterium]